MNRRLSDPRSDPVADDWLAEEGDVDWGGEPSPAPSRSRGAETSRARAEAPPTTGDDYASYDPRRLTVVQRRRAIALLVLVALVVVGIAVALTVFGSDEPTTPPTTAVLTTEPAVTEPPAATTTPPPAAETPATLPVELPESGQLAVGDSGAEVESLQTALTTLELYSGAVDGVFGATTQEAVRSFQQANDLPTDGIVGPATAEKLNEAVAAESVTP